MCLWQGDHTQPPELQLVASTSMNMIQDGDSVEKAAAAFITCMHPIAQRALRRDKAKFLEETAVKAEALRASDTRQCWQAIGTLRAYGGQRRAAGKTHQMADSDGTMATSPEGIADIVLQHFAKQEASEQMSPQALAEKHQSRGGAMVSSLGSADASATPFTPHDLGMSENALSRRMLRL